MITVDIEGLDGVKDMLERAGRQMPYAAMNALNDLAFKIRRAESDTAAKVFDRPRPQTVKNFWVNKATKTRLQAQIWFDQMFDKDYDQYMEAQVQGGVRKMKPSERRLGRFFVPGVGAKMDKYGNMQGGQTTQILSRLGRFGDVAGYDMNQTDKSKLKRARARLAGRKSDEYFIIEKPTGGLKPGVYKRGNYSNLSRGAKGSGKGIMPVMVFTKAAPKYHKRFPYFETANQVINENYVKCFTDAIDYALRTAR